MAKSSGSRGKSGGNSDKNTFDKLAKAAMSREMLAAGLTAASALHQAGKSFHIVEARPRLGGRMYTVRPPGSPS